MSEYDLHSNIDTRIALNNQEITENKTTNGNIIDTSGFESIEFIVQSDEVQDGDFVIFLEEGDDVGLSDRASVSADDTLGSLPEFSVADNDLVIRFGSIGKKRYQRLFIISTNVTSFGGRFSAVVVLGNSHTSPVA